MKKQMTFDEFKAKIEKELSEKKATINFLLGIRAQIKNFKEKQKKNKVCELARLETEYITADCNVDIDEIRQNPSGESLIKFYKPIIDSLSRYSPKIEERSEFRGPYVISLKLKGKKYFINAGDETYRYDNKSKYKYCFYTYEIPEIHTCSCNLCVVKNKSISALPKKLTYIEPERVLKLFPEMAFLINDLSNKET